MTESDEIYSLLVPLNDERLLVPRVCIAEVAAWTEPAPVADAAPWLLGTVEWNGRTIPLLSFEGACGRSVPTVSNRTRVVVFHAVTDRLHHGYFGIVTQGFPQLVRVSPSVLEAEGDAGWPAEAPVMCQARMVNQHPLIPDLDRIEAMLASAVA
ncbi:MAG: chemotaxis protein CheW [Pseudomonadota bacterium]